MSCEDFRTGGAQVFALRLAHALSKSHEVYLYSHHKKHVVPELLNKIAPGLKVLSYSSALDSLFYKIDGLFKRLGIGIVVREWLVSEHLRKVVLQYRIDLVHSHMFKADFVCAMALDKLDIPLVITMHGNYESFLSNCLKKEQEIIVNYPAKLARTLRRVNGIAYLTESNLEVLQENSWITEKERSKISIRKIYNGFTGAFSQNRSFSKIDLGIAETDIVFGLVARGHILKGWQQTIDAFLNLKTSSAVLVLVGESDYLSELEIKYRYHKNIKFMGFSNNPLDIIKIFDVGLMPSLFKESLPNVIVEYLVCGKPVIVTDTGESKDMIDVLGQKAGFVMKILPNNTIDIDYYSELMKKYIDHKLLLAEHSRLALEASKKFKMTECLSGYESLYKEVLGK